uniref:N-acyl-aliphatic-L-amino acid amidohydrolase n=1 Tax=Fagus sylvatica TaxID=28930 RepID=A0A2N9HVB8_FAGSY
MKQRNSFSLKPNPSPSRLRPLSSWKPSLSSSSNGQVPIPTSLPSFSTLIPMSFRSSMTSGPTLPSVPTSIHKGNIYARGSQDMKCVGMQYLEAIRKLKASGFQPLRSVYLSFVPDEEIGGDAGVKKFADTHVFNNLNVGIVLDEGLASPTENYRVFYAERSAWWLVIKAIGQPGHGSKLYDNSAMENLFKSIESVRRFRASQFDLVRAGLKAEGEVVSVNMAFLKAGTPSPTGFVMNLQPSEAQAGFDIRVPPTADPESLERRITEEWAPASRNMTFEFKQKNTVHDNFGKPLLTATDSSNPWWALLEEAVRKANGKIGKPEIFPAATDSHFFRKRGFLAIGFSPMANTPILLHDHNEFLNQDEYLKGIDVYVSIIKAYASYAEHTRKEGSKDELGIFCGELWVRSSNIIWLAGIGCANRCVMEDWGSKFWCSSTKPSWANGYGGMRQRRKLYGVKLWNSNMGVCGEIGSKSVQGPYGKSVWKSIRKGWPNFAANVNFRMGNGAHLKFWQHQWCGEIPLRLRFPELFQIASNPEASVKELARFDGTSFHWNVSFIRLVHDWELESVADFMDVLYSVIPTQEAIDTICWKLTLQKVFSVNSYYKHLLSIAYRSYPWKNVGKTLAPSKVNFFIWTTSLRKVLTIDNLRKRQLVLLDRCCMCKEDGESIDHLFLHCSVANELWQLVFSMFEIWWVMPYHVVDLLACWSGHTRSGIDAIRWGAAKSKCFTVGSYYRALSGTYHGSFPWKMIWKSRAPPRVAFFVWTATLGRILTIDNLRRRNVMVLDWCCMCKKGAESVEHLLLHCPFAGEIWSMVFGLFGVVWVMLRTILELLDCWQGCFVQRQIGETSLNEASSRSHQILRLTIESSAREFLGNDKSSSLTTTVNFVDLAGSERASQSLAAGARLKEGCHINRSLLTLGTVIRKLSKGRNGHIPFRDSKLTHILQSSLGGNARTAIICTMSPARSHVNVVMSDKALVKHLQRELSRLETELRSSGTTTVTSDSSALLRERDLLVEKLKKEIKELTLQRDLAQSQVKDLLRLVSDDSPALVLVSLVELQHRFTLRSFDASQYSDGHSSSTDDNLFQLPHFEENFVQTNSSPRLSVTVPTFVGTHQYQEETEEQTDEKSEDLCKEVRCIEMEEPSTNQYEDSSPKRYVNSIMLDSSLNRYVNSNMSSPAANTATSGVTVVDNGGSANQELGSHSPLLKEDKVLNSFLPDFVVPSPEKASPWLMEKDTPSSNCLRLTRSRSCKARLMTSYMPWFEKVEKHENTPPIWFEKDFTGRPEDLQMKLSTLNYGAIIDKLSRSNSQTSMGSAAVDELKVQDAKSSSDQNSVSIGTSIAGMSEMVNRQSENQHHDHAVLEMEPKPTASIKNVKDVGLDPMQDDPGSPSKWPSEFKRLQKEIIGLWNACNISLVHRTYFFLLFKGDPADSIYMESACVVAKLVGSVEPEQAFKEMFGLNFTPRPPSRSKYHRWKPIVKALLSPTFEYISIRTLRTKTSDSNLALIILQCNCVKFDNPSQALKTEEHLVEQCMCFIQEVTFAMHFETNVDKKGFWLVPIRENMVMNELSIIDSPASQTTLDELQVCDRINPNSVSLHSAHGLHGSWVVSMIAKVGELIKQKQGGAWHIAPPWRLESTDVKVKAKVMLSSFVFSAFTTCRLVNGGTWVLLFDGGVESKTLH